MAALSKRNSENPTRPLSNKNEGGAVNLTQTDVLFFIGTLSRLITRKYRRSANG
jgi:hypothetical protein